MTDNSDAARFGEPIFSPAPLGPPQLVDIGTESIRQNADKLVKLIKDYRDKSVFEVTQQFQRDIDELRISFSRVKMEWQKQLDERIAETIKTAQYWKGQAEKANETAISLAMRAKMQSSRADVARSSDTRNVDDTIEILRRNPEYQMLEHECDSLRQQKEKAILELQQRDASYASELDILKAIIKRWSARHSALQESYGELTRYVEVLKHQDGMHILLLIHVI